MPHVLFAPGWLLRLLAQELLLSAIVFLVAWGGTRLLGRRAPRLHQGLWSLVFVRLVLPPDLALPWSLRSLLERAVGLVLARAETTAPTEEGARLWLRTEATSAVLPAEAGTSFAALLLLGLWLVGVCLLGASFLRRRDLYRKTARGAVPVEHAGLQAALEDWRSALRLRRPVRLLRTARPCSPFTLGLLRPVIVLPDALLGGPGADVRELVEPILAHELAHIRRWDALWLPLQGALQVIYFFHPATWIAASRLNQARESLCDRMVLARGNISPRRYGQSLLAVVRLQSIGPQAPAWAPALGHDQRRLVMRIEDILRSRRHHRRSAWPTAVAWGTTLLAGALLLPLAESAPADAAPATAALSASEALPALETAAESATAPRPKLQHPVPGSRLTSPFGERQLQGKIRHHDGIDLAAPRGTQVLACATGVVEAATDLFQGETARGRVVVLDHGDGLKSIYSHLDSYSVRRAQRVRAGDTLGEVGNTGVSSGPHLHFEVWRNGEPVDPQAFLDP